MLFLVCEKRIGIRNLIGHHISKKDMRKHQIQHYRIISCNLENVLIYISTQIGIDRFFLKGLKGVEDGVKFCSLKQ